MSNPADTPEPPLPKLLGSRFVERRLAKFRREPASVRNALSLIVTATALTVLASAALMRIFDHKDFHSIWLSLWWALQTVTTVGYGDVVPKSASGRLVGALVMLEGTALIAIITAAITSTFIDRARAARNVESLRRQEEDRAAASAMHDELAARLDRIEALLLQSGRSPAGTYSSAASAVTEGASGRASTSMKSEQAPPADGSSPSTTSTP